MKIRGNPLITWILNTDLSIKRRHESGKFANLVGLVVLLSFAVLFSVNDAGARGFGKNKVQVKNLRWQVLNTPHFQIHYYDGADELAVRASLIAERAYREFSDRLGRDLPWRVPFILYNSHNDFSQTNISDGMIGEGTGGFSEPLRNRVVLPYNGSHEDFVHVIRHELVHSFMFHMAFGERTSMVGASFFQVPLWFAEGIAEWFSSGWDPEADMFVRDATINDYLMPIDQVGGFMVYKQGQAAMRLLAERYGDDKLVEFWWSVGQRRSVPAALHSIYGLTLEQFNQIYRKEMRKRYWPRYSDLEDVSEIARPLTDHRREGAFLNQMPALNPAGDKLVYFSDREGLVDLWLMSALDGRVIRQLGRSRRSGRFESFHSFRSAISFSPDGGMIALVAKSGNVETLHTINIKTGEVVQSIDLGLDVANSPVFSPNGESIALSGTLLGRTDLYLLSLVPGDQPKWSSSSVEKIELEHGHSLHRLTDDMGDEARPCWSPDGNSLLFLHNPLAEIEYEFEVLDGGIRRLNWAHPVGDAESYQSRLAPASEVVHLNLITGERRTILSADDPVKQVLWTPDNILILVNGARGFDNLALADFDPTTGSVGKMRNLTNLIGGASHLSYSQRADRLVFSAFQAGGYDLFAADNFFSQWALRNPKGTIPEPVAMEPPALIQRQSLPDPLLAPEKVGLVEEYSATLKVDLSQALAGGQVYFSPDVGLGMSNVVTFSDLLADHRLSFLINFYGSFSNSDLSVSYSYLKRRIDYGGGLFHYNNYYNSVFTGMGELLSSQTKFSEQNTGVFGFASYPLDTFRRFDFEVQYMNSTRTNYEYTGEEYILLPGDRTVKHLIQPTLSYSQDTALHGLHGPVAGSRWMISTGRSVAVSNSSVDRFTSAFDLRKYWLPWQGNSFAMHLSVAVSDGNDPRGFVLGGPWTLRGYQYYDFETIDNLSGTKMGLLRFEYRVPFVDYLIFGWPSRWGLSGIGAAAYVDLGTAWTHKVRFFGQNDQGQWGMDDLHGDFGLGLRANFMFMPMRLDWAWKTDLRQVQDMLFQFSIGPEF